MGPRGESYVTCAGNRLRREGTVNPKATWSAPRVVGGWEEQGEVEGGQPEGTERKLIIRLATCTEQL